jgi:hypothetical protein
MLQAAAVLGVCLAEGPRWNTQLFFEEGAKLRSAAKSKMISDLPQRLM